MRRIKEKHLGGEVLHIVLPMQVTFLNQRMLVRTLDEVPRGTHVLLDAQQTEYIDPDVLAWIREFHDEVAPARDVHLSMVGFGEIKGLEDEIQFVDQSTRELQDNMTTAKVLEVLLQGIAVAGFNVVDIHELSRLLSVPVVIVMRRMRVN